MLHRFFWSISVAFILLAISVAAQGKQYGIFLENYDVFQARYDGSAVSKPGLLYYDPLIDLAIPVHRTCE
jgi:hypothetical protein